MENMIISRDFYLNQLLDKKDNGRVKVITGIRRCGKSELLFTLYKDYLLSTGVKKKQIIALQLDGDENIKYRDPLALGSYIRKQIKSKSKKYYVFIDEIQFCYAVFNPYVKEKEPSITFVDTVLGLMKIPNIDLYITGSNSKMLSSEILTQFSDRGDQIHVQPFSFSEIYHLFDNTQDALTHYLNYGGMPEIYKLKTEEQKVQHLKQLFKTTYIRDVLLKYDIKNEEQILDKLLDFVSSVVGSLVSFNNLSKQLAANDQIKISPNTIQKYLSYFEESFVLSNARRYDIKGSKYFRSPSKYYFADIGLRNARLNFRQIEDNHLTENVIYNELIKRGYNVDVGMVEYEVNKANTRQKRQAEVDFVANLGHKRYYIQYADNINTKEKREQETNSLLRIKDNFKKIVVVKDNIIAKHDDNGILYLGLKQFLLEPNAIDI
ncbi:ATP-binding protein [Mycoplasma mycoides]|uniref:ATP-binding protein n=1 Tax=Mycoplasma mycoides TaxID=2102 RepID=UPI00223F579E|nr:ATP-binding protein [Mycoplasma mycoides]QVK08676.1 ATP-binding protein [Mycoplasma mycoides subsp. capri]